MAGRMAKISGDSWHRREAQWWTTSSGGPVRLRERSDPRAAKDRVPLSRDSLLTTAVD